MKAAAKAIDPPASTCHVAKLPSAIIATTAGHSKPKFASYPAGLDPMAACVRIHVAVSRSDASGVHCPPAWRKIKLYSAVPCGMGWLCDDWKPPPARGTGLRRTSLNCGQV